MYCHDSSLDNTIFCECVSYISQAASTCTHGNIRLNQTSNSTDGNAGRVEICYNGQWKSIHDNQWDDQDARVACNQLGFAREGKHSRCRMVNC